MVLVPRGGVLVATDFALGVTHRVSPGQAALLVTLDNWRTAGDVVARLPGVSPRSVRAALTALHRRRLIEASDEPEHSRRRAMRGWSAWNPEAGLLHFGTRGRPHLSLSEVREVVDERLLLGDRPPPPSRPLPARGHVALPPPRRHGALPRALLARRSWRRFAPRPLALADVATLLGLTFGVQRWMSARPGVWQALKTSPSGGACHALEAYLVVERVAGLPRGVYRYHPDAHALVRVRAGTAPGEVARCLRQPWFVGCGAGVFVTAVWPRVQWKYRFPRAYRTVLLEAGHFVQTFCLVATWLDLAPFCTAAFDERRLERLLRVDGVREGVIYAAGAGHRPPGVAWAPWPDAADEPATRPPASGRGPSRRSV